MKKLNYTRFKTYLIRFWWIMAIIYMISFPLTFILQNKFMAFLYLISGAICYPIMFFDAFTNKLGLLNISKGGENK